MRSKEVSDAIDLLENGIADYIIEFYCTKEEKDKQLCGTYCEKMKEDCIYNQAIDKTIEYIKELEQLPNKIRDRIKELEKLNFNNYANEYDNGNEVKYYILKEFKEIIGE